MSKLDAGASADFDEFIYHVSHDVRAGLRAISILPGWILEDLQKDNARLSSDVLKNFQLLSEQTQRIDRLLLDLRDYSRLGRICDDPTSNLLSEAIREASEKVYGLGQFEVKSAVGDLRVRCAKNELTAIFFHLISNTLTHSETAKPTILISADLGGDHLTLTFEDDGVGIAPEFRERVFGILARLQSRDERQGSGVGLTSCRRIVEAYGGSITLSEPRTLSGVRVEIILPASVVSGAPEMGRVTEEPRERRL